MFATFLLAAMAIDPGEPRTMQAILGYVLVILMFGMGVVILWKIAVGTIDISALLEEHGGGASMSRFQLLIFTFVIALSLFLLVTDGKNFPEVPAGVLTLLGISATTYGVSKGIQASSNLPPKGVPEDVTVAAAVDAGAAAGAQAGAAMGAAAGARTGAVAGAAAGVAAGLDPNG
jgi:hypothetical protein